MVFLYGSRYDENLTTLRLRKFKEKEVAGPSVVVKALQFAVSIGLSTRVCRTDALLLNLPGMSICENSLERRVSVRIAWSVHL